jgi:CspA family cold shock protein
MTKGKIKWYNEAKGFGFIASDKNDDIFIHRSGLKNSYEDLQPGQEVIFELKQGEKGPVAFNVELSD